MAKLESEKFSGREAARVYLAGRVREAERVEKLLTNQGIDYVVEVEPYAKRLLGFFPSEYAGAAFYVLSGQAAQVRAALRAGGLVEGLEEEEPE